MRTDAFDSGLGQCWTPRAWRRPWRDRRPAGAGGGRLGRDGALDEGRRGDRGDAPRRDERGAVGSGFRRASVRSPWAIGNSLHRVLDATLDEDAQRNRAGRGARTAPSGAERRPRRAQPNTGSMRGKIKRAGWDADFLLDMVRAALQVKSFRCDCPGRWEDSACDWAWWGCDSVLLRDDGDTALDHFTRYAELRPGAHIADGRVTWGFDRPGVFRGSAAMARTSFTGSGAGACSVAATTWTAIRPSTTRSDRTAA